MLEEQGQTPVAHSEVKQSITGTSNDTDIHIRGASRGDTENRQCNRQIYETKEEKHQFICESFQLIANEILNADEKLKEGVIKVFLTLNFLKTFS